VYKNIKLAISSACEKAGSGGLCIMDQIPNEEAAAAVSKISMEKWKENPEAVIKCNPPGIWDQVMSGVIRSEFVIPEFQWNLESYDDDDDESQRRRTASARVTTIEAIEALAKQVALLQDQQKSELQLLKEQLQEQQRLQLQEQQMAQMQLQEQQRLQLQEQMWSSRILLLVVVMIGMGISFSQALLRKQEPSQQQHAGRKAGRKALL
jgi:hypothetical protein